MKKILEKISLIVLGILFSFCFFTLEKSEQNLESGENLEKGWVENKRGEEEILDKVIEKENKIKSERKDENKTDITKKALFIEKAENQEEDSDDNFLEVGENREFFLVYSVVDGDTLKINRNGKIETVRVIGIDTPETVHPTKTVQCFGKEASLQAKFLLENKKVMVVYDESQGQQDKYGRTLAYIILPDGQDFGEVMLKAGFAHEYTYNQKYQKQAVYKQAENYAKQNELGLWNKDTCFEFEQSLSQNNSAQTAKTVQSVAISQTDINKVDILNDIFSSDENNGCVIKGNISSKKEKIYHLPGQAFYEKTIIDEMAGEKWFCTEEEAKISGWRKALR